MSRPFNDSLYFDPENYGIGVSCDEFYDCSVCRQEQLDPIDLRRHKVNGEAVCHECVTLCDHCGEYADDDSQFVNEPLVRYRDGLNDGKLSPLSHAYCAAIYLSSFRVGDVLFDSEEMSGDEIGAALEYWAEYQGVTA